MPLTIHSTRFVQELLLRRAAIVLDDEQDYLIETRLAAAFGDDSTDRLDELIGEARGNPNLQQRIIESLTTNETLFFRDQTPFVALRNSIIPRIQSRRPGQGVNIWSAACSTGQEAYSIAMLVADAFPDLTRRIQIAATDLSLAVIERARTGRYRQLEVNRGLPAHYLVRFFSHEGTTWLIDQKIRQMVSFSQVNLLEAWPVQAPLDVVFMRNVLIYLDRSARQQILERLLPLMAPDGVLFLGVAETTSGIHEGWEPVNEGRASFFKPRRPLPMRGA